MSHRIDSFKNCMQLQWLHLLKHPVHSLSLGFGSGLIKKAPGTFGSLVGALLLLVLLMLPVYAYGLVVLLTFVLGILVCETTARTLNVKDPSEIVFDEIHGMMVIGFIFYCGVEFTLLNGLLAFAVFRFFDILKPFPVSWADQKFSGGFGIMFDDTLAALLGFLLLLLSFNLFS